jgi:hypothetical protein
MTSGCKFFLGSAVETTYRKEESNEIEYIIGVAGMCKV